MLPDNEQITGIGVLDDNVLADRETLIDKLMKALHLKGPSVSRSKDKRQVPRFSVSVPISYHIDNESNRKIIKSMDLSETGIRISVAHKLETGTRINLEIKLPNMQEFLKIRGVVVWAKPSINASGHWDCGVAFEDLRQVSKKEKIISLIADQHCRFALIYTKEFVCQPIDNFEDMREAYRVLYKEYLKRGYCAPNEAQLHYNIYSLLPTTCAFNLKNDQKLLGTISIIGDSPCGIPMESLFPEEIQKLRAQNRKIAEVGFLALDASEFKKGWFSLTNFKKQASLFRLYKIMFDYARFTTGVTDLIIGVHPKHETLYRYLNFEPFGPARSYPGAEGNPALPLRMDVQKAVEKNISVKHGPGTYFLKHITPEEVLGKKMKWSNEMLVYLLVEKKMVWDALKPDQQESLEKIYPGLKALVTEGKARQAAAVSENIIIESCNKLKDRIMENIKLKSFSRHRDPRS